MSEIDRYDLTIVRQGLENKINNLTELIIDYTDCNTDNIKDIWVEHKKFETDVDKRFRIVGILSSKIERIEKTLKEDASKSFKEYGDRVCDITNIREEITLLKSLHLKNQKIIVSGICWLIIMTIIIKFI